MEFPDLGEQCCFDACKQLDFLPVKCYACQKVFCKNHYLYTQHNCPEAYRHNNQVPVCPLCSSPVSLKPGESPDAVVGQHIDNDCQSEKAQTRRKIYSNKCALKGCKQKELVPVTCQKCRKNYCLRHRHEMDHQCSGFSGSRRTISDAGAAAVARFEKTKEPSKTPQKTMMSTVGSEFNRERQMRQTQSRNVPSNVADLQMPGLSEEEALQQALALSLQDNHAATSTTSSTTEEACRRQQEMDDEALARAIQESEREARANGVARQPSSEKKSCVLS